jgi:hypothetical protein
MTGMRLTISPLDVLVGPQRPRLLSVPPYEQTLGEDAADAAAIAGLELDPWQRYALNDILAIRPGGRPATRTAALVVPRQNGKGSVIEAYVLEGLFLSNLKLITYSAHETKTADEMFDRMRQLIQGTPAFAKRLADNGVRLANGQQQITLKSGARLRVIARTKSSGRGFSGDRIILDEAQELQHAHMRSMVPTLATRPDAHVFMAGSTPEPEKEVFPGILERGRAGNDRSLCYLEWSVPDPELGEQVDLDDRELWRQANPGYGIRLFDETIQDLDRALLDDEGFARERLGIIGGGGYGGVIDDAVWAERADEQSRRTGSVVFAVQVDRERRRASICSAGYRADGRPHVEVVQRGLGTGWIVERLVELNEKWKPAVVVLNPSSASGSLLPSLQARGLAVTTEPEKTRGLLLVQGTKYGAACGAFYDAATTDDDRARLAHLNQTSLNTAVAAARKRFVGDSWVWNNRESADDITPLEAATLALQGLRVTSAKPKRRTVAVAY